MIDPALLPALFDALAVAQTGSVHAAARRLHKTPSAVSQQLRRLTDALGTSPFERRGRGLRLTPTTQRCLQSMTRLFDDAERLFEDLGSGHTTTLRLAASDYLSEALLVPALRALNGAGVTLHFDISAAHSSEALTQVIRGDVEIALVSHATERANLKARTLLQQPFLWVGTRGDKRRSLIERLRNEAVLRLAPGSVGRAVLDDFLQENRIQPVSTIDVQSVPLLLSYVTGGIGIGLVPALALTTPARRRCVLAKARVPALSVKTVVSEGRRLAPQVSELVRQLEREGTRHQAELRRWLARVPEPR